MERYGSKPAKRPSSDFVIEETGQLNCTNTFVSIVIINLCKMYMHTYCNIPVNSHGYYDFQ